jgi:hypothetical protein
LTTHYTVTINANGTGSVTITAAGLALSPTSPTQYAVVGNRTIARTSDFTTGGDFFANTLNDELDQQTIFAQQNAEGLQRALQAPQTDPTTINMTLPAKATRANKTLAFDADGNPTTGVSAADVANAITYATNAANSATAAASSASSASSSASSATSSASTASTQASNASTSASNASTSASSASTSATNAASSASTATTQASNASTSATNAATSASTATTQATNAASSATSAATAKTAAESARDATLAAYDSFDDRYLGAKSSDPSVDNDGNALTAGSLYFNSVDNVMKLWTGSAWVAAYVSGSGFMDLSSSQTAAGTKTFSSNPILSGGTANGVAYLNGSKVLTTGSALVFDGTNFSTTGTINLLTVGRGAGAVANNTAVGASALAANTTGQYNTAIGNNALLANTTGGQNIGIGYGAVDANTTGNHVIGIGQNALGANTTADDNTAVGWNSAQANTTGANNTALGAIALYTNSTGVGNTATGYNAGYSTTGSYNTFIGYSSGSGVTSGGKNVILGAYTGAAAPISATASNHIVFSDGDGTVRGYFNNSGSGFFSGATVAYPGNGNTNTGIFLESAGQFCASRDNTVVARFNRNTSDGTLLSFARDGTEQGTISVSGGTVSYNAFAGSHWSQLSDGSKPNILRGTVLDSINELIQWPDEPTTERLCKVKVSDTAGSKKVYGVFMDWDNDWTATNDMYVTAVGAFICRVNASVTVQEGDLLESNGDGTARVQADDIIRSSTIGKVTCTEKTHQYDDGSYCVPTVLYCG